MIAYPDTGFLVSLYLPETTSASAQMAVAGCAGPLPIISLTVLELRNALWLQFERQIREGVYEEKVVSTVDLYAKARALSDAYTPIYGARSLDLLHVAAALLLGASQFFSFDGRQRRVAVSEGLMVLPQNP